MSAPAFTPTQAEQAVQRAALERDRALGSEPARRRRHGIVHTPPALARAVTVLADHALREGLGLGGGIGDAALSLVDPACGPGAFLAAALAHGAGGATAPCGVLGLDLDAGAVARAAAALSGPFAAAGWPLTLESADTLADPRWLEPEGDGPVLVLGNPPWSGSAQPSPARFMAELLADFRRDADGLPLGERKLGVLADPYVRFVRWAMARVARAPGGGVLALVTNGSFLDGPVHRGMRARLLECFDTLDVVDLGGNALLSRGGSRDENVFGVRPSVAITVGVRRTTGSSRRPAAPARLRLAALRGDADGKLAVLLDRSALDHASSGLSPSPPLLRFTRGVAASPRYAGFASLAEAMPFHREGVQTNRDAVVVDADRGRLLDRLRRFAAGDDAPDLARANAPLAHYDPERARARVASALARDPEGNGGLLHRLAYRPFDTRWFAALAPLCHRPRPALLAAMQRAPFALVSVRKDRGNAPWAHFAAVVHPVDNCFLSLRSSCRTRAFPACTPDGDDNLDPELAMRLSELRGQVVDARAFAHYALAVMASGPYRTRHDEALRADYPRLPLPEHAQAFEEALAIGAALATLFCEGASNGAAELEAQELPSAPPRVGHHALTALVTGDARPRRLAALIARASALAIDWG